MLPAPHMMHELICCTWNGLKQAYKLHNKGEQIRDVVGCVASVLITLMTSLWGLNFETRESSIFLTGLWVSWQWASQNINVYSKQSPPVAGSKSMRLSQWVTHIVGHEFKHRWFPSFPISAIMRICTGSGPSLQQLGRLKLAIPSMSRNSARLEWFITPVSRLHRFAPRQPAAFMSFDEWNHEEKISKTRLTRQKTLVCSWTTNGSILASSSLAIVEIIRNLGHDHNLELGFPIWN